VPEKTSSSRGIAALILDLGTGWSWTVSVMPWPLYPWWKSVRFPLNVRLGTLSSLSRWYREEKNLLCLQEIVKPISVRLQYLCRLHCPLLCYNMSLTWFCDWVTIQTSHIHVWLALSLWCLQNCMICGSMLTVRWYAHWGPCFQTDNNTHWYIATLCI
jgi:hypothetical protein